MGHPTSRPIKQKGRANGRARGECIKQKGRANGRARGECMKQKGRANGRARGELGLGLSIPSGVNTQNVTSGSTVTGSAESR